MNTLIKGIIIGLGKIIPGVSGSILAITLGVYEKCIDIISNLKNELKYNIKFLFLLSVGIITGIILGSKLIYILLNTFYIPIMFLFIGLISGTSVDIFKEIKISNKKDYVFFILPFILIYLLNFLPSNYLDTNNLFVIVLLGFIDAFTMIVPGISGTAIFMILGVYDFILLLFSNMFNCSIIFFSIGIILGIIITSKIINYCFKNYYYKTYQIILGLMISSILLLIKNTLTYNYNLLEFIISMFLLLIGYFLGHIFSNK